MIPEAVITRSKSLVDWVRGRGSVRRQPDFDPERHVTISNQSATAVVNVAQKSRWRRLLDRHIHRNVSDDHERIKRSILIELPMSYGERPRGQNQVSSFIDD
jgi:hypothetical protein